MTVLLVALGAAAGTCTRYVVAQLLDVRLPVGTIAVNLLGSFLLGLFTGSGLTGQAGALLGTGFCGSVTTYSSFAVQTHNGGWRLGAVNVLVTVVPAILLCALGFRLGAR